jgi:RNA polymerase sigma-70 factor (ECF subfamily)
MRVSTRGGPIALPFPDLATVVGRTPAAVRQRATAARRKVAADREAVAPAGEHDAVVRAFSDEHAGGVLGIITRLLDPSVVLRSDGGGVVSAALNPVTGADRVARFMVGVMTKRPTWRLEPRATGDGLGMVYAEGEQVRGVLNLRVADGLITDVRAVLNPAKLGAWG